MKACGAQMPQCQPETDRGGVALLKLHGLKSEERCLIARKAVWLSFLAALRT